MKRKSRCPSNLSRRLVKKLNKDCGLNLDENRIFIVRTYAGHWQTSAGACLFELYTEEGAQGFISCHPASELVKADKIEIVRELWDTQIYPVTQK